MSSFLFEGDCRAVVQIGEEVASLPSGALVRSAGRERDLRTSPREGVAACRAVELVAVIRTGA